MRRYRSLKLMRKRLIDLIIEYSFRYSEKPKFRLASGRLSNFYFNCKPVTLSPEGMYLIGNLVFDLIKGVKSWRIKAVGGLTLGADPVANAVSYTSYLKGKPLSAFVVRKEAKGHGTMQWIEGEIEKGTPVLVVEDVITTGGSTIKAIQRAKQCGLNVKGVIVLIDRQEGGREKIEKKGIPVKSLLTREEIFDAFKSAK